MANKNKATVTTVEEPCYEKAQLVASARYARRKDVLAALLKDGEKYTITQVDEIIAGFYNRTFTERKGE